MKSLLDVATVVDLVLNSRSAETIPLRHEDGSGAAVDYSDSTFRLQVKTRNGNAPAGEALLTLETGTGISGDHGAGEIDITFPAAGDGGLPPGKYIYDMLRLESGEPVGTVQVGTIDVFDGVTEVE